LLLEIELLRGGKLEVGIEDWGLGEGDAVSCVGWPEEKAEIKARRTMPTIIKLNIIKVFLAGKNKFII